MAEKIKMTISPAVAAFVRPGTPPDVRMSGCAAAEQMPAPERLMLLFCLSKDSDTDIRAAALSCLQSVPADTVDGYVHSEFANPLIVDALQKIEHCKAEQLENSFDIPTDAAEMSETPSGSESDEPEEELPVNEEAEEFVSKFKTAQLMGIAEKIKMALSGDKEWRSILVKDANKLVSGSVIKNPRITEAEILTLVKSGIQNDEIMRLICANKEWVKNYQIRRALIENNRTPVQNAMKYLGTMGEKDLASFAKSKNIASVISTMAKRLLLNKKK